MNMKMLVFLNRKINKQNSHDETLLHNLIVVASLYHREDEEVEKYLKELEVLNPSNVLVTTVKNMSSRVEQLEKEFMQITVIIVCFLCKFF